MSVTKPRTPAPTKPGPSAPRKQRPAPPADTSILKAHHIRLIILVTILSYLYKSLSHRIPYIFAPSALPTTNPTCKTYHPTSFLNCEDFVPLPSPSTKTLITCDPARRQWTPATSTFPDYAHHGFLYLWDPTDPTTPPQTIEVPQAADDFHPLGISTVTLTPEEAGPAGFTTRVFAIDQARKAAQVHIFDLNPHTGDTRPIRVIRDPRLNSPNSIVAENSTSFFVTNDGFFNRKSSVGLVLEALSGLPLSEVLRINFGVESLDIKGHPSVQVVAKVGLGNGIEYDRERRTLWVASMTHGLYSFLLPSEKETQGLEVYPLAVKGPWTRFFRTSMVPDNLFLVGRRLYISQHGKLVNLLKSLNAENAEAAPKVSSWVVSLDLPPVVEGEATDVAILTSDKAWWDDKENGAKLYLGRSNGGLRKEEMRFGEVFEDDGGVYGSISTGAVVNGKFMAVGLVEKGVLVCDEAKSEE